MPFGPKCEYATFNACVSDQQGKGHTAEEARRICGALQRDTEEKCKEVKNLVERTVIERKMDQ